MKIVNLLKARIESDPASVEAYVAQDALDHEPESYDEQNVPGHGAQTYLEDVTQYGCVSGICSGLIYYTDTHTFYREFQGEADEVLADFESNVGEGFKFDGKDVANTLAWMLYEETARKLLEEIVDRN